MAERPLTRHERGDFILHAVAKRLSTHGQGWVVDGETVRGPGSLAVVLGRGCYESLLQHIELGIVVNVNRPGVSILWDHAVGHSLDERQAITLAVQNWDIRTMPVVRELVDQRGEFATHIAADHPEGLPGWDVIHGPMWGWSVVAGEAAMLKEWVMTHPLLPTFAPLVIPLFDSPLLNGLRISLGGTAQKPKTEVLVNRKRSVEASALLADMAWPRPTRLAGISAFVLAFHNA